MRFLPPLESGVLLRRYKRFLADVEVAGRGVVTMHCANTGAMLGCDTPGSPAWFSTSGNPKRKYPQSLELVEVRDGGRVCTVCVNTARPNAIVEEALAAGRIAELRQGPARREVPIPGEAGRFDFALGGEAPTFVEVKSVTLCRDGVGAFPDAVSERARRHVEALARCVARGSRSVLLFCAPHTGIRRVTVADDIDPRYGEAVREAVAAGVEVLAYGCVVTPGEVAIEGPLPLDL
ncbi:MAG: DNA/RNA nuclease SfsA [Gammaproteobacteria bacterium]|nr:DNA/RNA nuclease SfsA [Gammaproteobacteria bacterium]